MPSVARSLVLSALIVPLAALASCSGNTDAPAGPTSSDAGRADAASDADLSCRYKDFRGNDAVCKGYTTPDGGECPSRDGCNYVGCNNGTFMESGVLCWCTIDTFTFNGKGRISYGTRTADDGCTVCTCGKDTGKQYLEPGFTCDSSACK